MENNSYAYAETLEILDNMSEVYVKKIPNNMIKFFKENASKDYKKHIVSYIPLKKQQLNRKTIAILAMINFKYWCKNAVHKREKKKN